ncbi:hypothetical protein [Aurantiacibacter sediminis]|uniref:Uncharacterized protein n=1 Tax=Aurantiacibacter sediminis TaxID=2793064 RepID=A0ABS0N5S9_9SPHN|nr:hypothetical protein [Aurantiacibacter sediminis]MBH5323160.1 hypothetical protein [Aurantiacibacter sediminis]
MNDVPFTITADLDLGTRVAPYVRDSGGEVTIVEGEVPDAIESDDMGTNFSVNSSQFLLNVPNGATYLVEGGERITYRRNGASDRDVALFLLGSAWGALCFQRGLVPLHASAVIHKGKVHAFTGQSGAGKSTLAAALAKRGLDFFTDDVLIIDPAQISDGAARCFAGQKDMKLWADALTLTGASKMGAVRDEPGFNKFFATPATSESAGSGNLASLSILKNENARRDRQPVEIEKLSGAVAIKRLRDSIYRMRFGVAIMGRQKLYSALAQLISAVHVQTFDRPLNKHAFPETTAAMRGWICDFGKSND